MIDAVRKLESQGIPVSFTPANVQAEIKKAELQGSYVGSDLLQKAREYGIDISKVRAENIIQQPSTYFQSKETKKPLLSTTFENIKTSKTYGELIEKEKQLIKEREAYSKLVDKATAFKEWVKETPQFQKVKGVYETLSNKKRESIIEILISEDIAPTEENIQLYRQYEKKYANPFTNPDLSASNILGFRDTKVTSETGEYRVFNFERTGYPRSAMEQLNVPSLLLTSAFITPKPIVSAVQKPPAQTRVIATIEKQPEFTKISALGEIKQKGVKPVYVLSKDYLKASGDKFVSVGKGFTMNVETGFKLPRTQVLKLKNVKKFVSVSTGETIGEARFVKGLRGFEAKAEIGRGSISDDFAVVSAKKGNILRYVGGEAKPRLTKKGIDLVVKKPTLKAVAMDITETMNPEKIKWFVGGGKKTPFSVTFQEEKAVSSTFANIKKAGEKALLKPVVKTKPLVPVIKEEIATPQKEQSQFYGTGMYERTEEGQGILSLGSQKTFEDIKLRSDFKLLSVLKFQERVKQIDWVTYKEPQIEKLKIDQILKQPHKFKERISQLRIEREKQPDRIKLRELSRSVLKPRPFIPPPPKIPEKEVYRRQNVKIKKSGSSYNVYVRRFGEDVLIGTRDSLERAKKLLKEILETTLGASGFVAVKGKKQKIDLGVSFRPSKVDPFRQVQVRSQRLGRRSEVKEIQYFKKRKAGKKQRIKKINWFK